MTADCEHDFKFMGSSYAEGMSPHMVQVTGTKASNVEEAHMITNGITTMVVGCRKCGALRRDYCAGRQLLAPKEER